MTLINLDPDEGLSFYRVTASDASAEYPGSTLRYLNLADTDRPIRFNDPKAATDAMVEWCGILKGSWYLQVERAQWHHEREDGLTWWETEVDWSFEGGEAWWNHDDDKVELS